MNHASRSNADPDFLLEAVHILSGYPNVQDGCAPLAAVMEARTRLDRITICLLDHVTGNLRVTATTDPAFKPGARIHLGAGTIGRVFETRMTASEAQPYGTFLAAAAVSGESTVGVVSAFRHGKGASKADTDLLESVASLLSEAIRLRRRVRDEVISELEDRVPRGAQKAEDPCASAIVGTSDAMKAAFDLLGRVAATDATVLILGESGTGKELFSREIHARSRRANGPFIAVNCAALPESIIESELFGHEKGSFTGAVASRKGRFELAEGGTIFLDEIGELNLGAQVKLLRVIQERVFDRVGGTGEVKADVRVLAATNRDLESAIKVGTFREDLYWRLNVFPIHLPPLRERRSDIMMLADHFTEKHARIHGKEVRRISSPAIDLLTSYHWPGNVRELENCIERAVILTTDAVIHSYHLPPSLQSAESSDTAPASTLEAALSRLEKEMLIEALKITGGKMAAAARCLDITVRQMGLRLHRYGIDWHRYRTKT